MNIAPGTTVRIEIAKRPTSEAARKTLTRLARKDPSVMKVDRRRQAKRPSWEEWRRGNYQWHHQMKTKPPVSMTPGSTYNLRATVDVLRDLASVERFVTIKPA